MGRPQFSIPVEPSGTFETDASTTYALGDSLDVDGSAYPYTVDPANTIEELIITKVAAEIDVKITTSGGDTFTFPLDSVGTFNRWEIDSVEFSDPNNNAPALAATWAEKA